MSNHEWRGHNGNSRAPDMQSALSAALLDGQALRPSIYQSSRSGLAQVCDIRVHHNYPDLVPCPYMHWKKQGWPEKFHCFALCKSSVQDSWDSFDGLWGEIFAASSIRSSKRTPHRIEVRTTYGAAGSARRRQKLH